MLHRIPAPLVDFSRFICVCTGHVSEPDYKYGAPISVSSPVFLKIVAQSLTAPFKAITDVFASLLLSCPPLFLTSSNKAFVSSLLFPSLSGSYRIYSLLALRFFLSDSNMLSSSFCLSPFLVLECPFVFSLNYVIFESKNGTLIAQASYDASAVSFQDFP